MQSTIFNFSNIKNKMFHVKQSFVSAEATEKNLKMVLFFDVFSKNLNQRPLDMFWRIV